MIIVARFGIHLERLQKLQNRAARLIMKLNNEHGQPALALKSLGWKLLEERSVEMKARMTYKTVNKLAPSRLCDLFQNVNETTDYNLRGSATRVHIPMPKTEFFKQSFCYNGAKLRNQIPDEIRSSVSLVSFCNSFLPRPLISLLSLMLLLYYYINY